MNSEQRFQLGRSQMFAKSRKSSACHVLELTTFLQYTYPAHYESNDGKCPGTA